MSFDAHSGFSGRAGHPGRPPADQPVLYYTTRPFNIALSAQLLPLFILAPFMLAAPETMVAVGLTALATAWWMHRAFRFELTADTLRLRLGPFSLSRELPLREIVAAEGLDVAGKPLRWGHRADAGHLRLKLKDGEDLLVVGLADPMETADAVETLRRRLTG